MTEGYKSVSSMKRVGMVSHSTNTKYAAHHQTKLTGVTLKANKKREILHATGCLAVKLLLKGFCECYHIDGLQGKLAKGMKERSHLAQDNSGMKMAGGLLRGNVTCASCSFSISLLLLLDTRCWTRGN